MWKAAIEITKDHPLAGIGSDEFGYVYNTQYISPLAKERPKTMIQEADMVIHITIS